MLAKKKSTRFFTEAGTLYFVELLLFFSKFFLLQALRDGDGHGDGGADHRVVAH